MTIIEALDDPRLLGSALGRDPDTWATWRVALAALHGLPLDDAHLATFRRFTGRMTPPASPCREAFFVVGRRGGKSRMAALLAVFHAAIADGWRQHLAHGERAVIGVAAADRQQAGIVYRYIVGLLESNPMLSRLIVRQLADEVWLANGAIIRVTTANFRTLRGPTYQAFIADELAFWTDLETASNPSAEVLAAVRPGLLPGGLLLGISSAYAASGVLYEQFEKHWAKGDSATLVWRAGTRDMNPTFDPDMIDAAMAADPTVAASEYFSEWRAESGSLLDGEAFDRAVCHDRTIELPPTWDVRESDDPYQAFVDVSGGIGDSFALAICHREQRLNQKQTARELRIVVDVVRSWAAPFSPPIVIIECADLLRRYGIDHVTGDRYAAAFTVELFRSCGIHYRPAEKDASTLYLEFLSAMNSGVVELPELKSLRSEFLALQRKPGGGGRDRVVAPRGVAGHSDSANAVAGGVGLCLKRRSYVTVF